MVLTDLVHAAGLNAQLTESKNVRYWPDLPLLAESEARLLSGGSRLLALQHGQATAEPHETSQCDCSSLKAVRLFGVEVVERERLNWWLTLSANFAVLIGIALIVVELSQNRDSIRAQTRNELSSQLVELLSQVAADGKMGDLLYRAEAGEELSPPERVQFQTRTLAMLRYFENVHYQYRNGMYDAEEYLAQQEAWRRFMSGTPYVRVWCSWRDTFSPSFKVALEELGRSQEC